MRNYGLKFRDFQGGENITGITKFTQSEVQSCDLPRLRDLWYSLARANLRHHSSSKPDQSQGHNSRTVCVSTSYPWTGRYCVSQWRLEWRMLKFTTNNLLVNFCLVTAPLYFSLLTTVFREVLYTSYLGPSPALLRKYCINLCIVLPWL